MIVTLIIYIVFVLPIALKLYNKDKGSFKVVKAFNIIVTFLLILFYGDYVKENIVWLREYSFPYKESLYIKVGLIPPLLNYIGYFAFTILTFVITAMSVGLAMRNKKAYKHFFILIPFVFSSQVLYLYFKLFERIQSQYSIPLDVKLLIFIIVLLAIKWGIILTILYNRKFKQFYNATFEANPEVGNNP